jgi:hypothetical protein
MLSDNHERIERFCRAWNDAQTIRSLAVVFCPRLGVKNQNSAAVPADTVTKVNVASVRIFGDY